MFTHLANVRALCEQLGLYNIASGLIPLYDIPEDILEKLEIILRQEVCFKDERRYKILRGRSHLLEIKTFEDFDNKFQPVMTDTLIAKIKHLTWVEEKFNIIMLGGTGTGKTHIATAIGHYAIRNGMKVFYASVKDLLYFIKTQNTIGKSRTRLGYIHGCELLIVDEFGYEPMTKEETLAIYNLINNVNRTASVVLATNRSFDLWPELFGDVVLANTLLDRLIEKCQVLDLGEDSYRVAIHQTI